MTDEGKEPVATSDTGSRQQRRTAAPDGDKLNRWLLYAVLSLIVVILGLVVWTVATGLTQPLAPRTAAERNIYRTEAAVKAAPKDPKARAEYAAALVAAGRYGEALTAIAAGEKAVGKAPGLLLSHARVIDAQGDWQGALKEADAAVASFLAARQKKVDEASAKGIFIDPTTVEADGIVAAHVFRAEIFTAHGQLDDAIAAYGIALEQDSRMSDVLVARADLYVELKKYEEARKDYEAALQYIPDYQPALKGLAKIKEVTK
jgi:tetratricopeptide (TPR) repeat protein